MATYTSAGSRNSSQRNSGQILPGRPQPSLPSKASTALQTVIF